MIRYIKLYKWANRTEGRRRALKIVDLFAVVLVVLAYAGFLTYLLLVEGIEPCVRAVVFAALPFGLFSYFRKGLNAKRPYEDMDFEALGFPIPSKKVGSSFPSRHVFSAALIGTMMLTRLPIVGVLALLVAALLAWVRVVRGIHYMRDVTVGALVGVLAGVIALFLM